MSFNWFWKAIQNCFQAASIKRKKKKTPRQLLIFDEEIPLVHHVVSPTDRRYIRNCYRSVRPSVFKRRKMKIQLNRENFDVVGLCDFPVLGWLEMRTGQLQNAPIKQDSILNRFCLASFFPPSNRQTWKWPKKLFDSGWVVPLSSLLEASVLACQRGSVGDVCGINCKYIFLLLSGVHV